MSSIDVVIVNWNSGDCLRRCLSSLASSIPESKVASVTVVDNGSTDGSLHDLCAHDLPLAIKINKANEGFGRAANLGASGGGAELILFLNPDVELFPASVSGAVNVVECDRNPDIAAVGVRLIQSDGSTSRTCARIPTAGRMVAEISGLHRIWPRAFCGVQMRDWDHGSSGRVDHVTGAFYLIRRKVFSELRGFDERFFMYHEDLDLSSRLRKAGWSCWYAADVSAVHDGGGSSRKILVRRSLYLIYSRIQYCFKHFGAATATGLALVSLLLEPLVRAVAMLEKLLMNRRSVPESASH